MHMGCRCARPVHLARCEGQHHQQDRSERYGEDPLQEHQGRLSQDRDAAADRQLDHHRGQFLGGAVLVHAHDAQQRKPGEHAEHRVEDLETDRGGPGQEGVQAIAAHAIDPPRQRRHRQARPHGADRGQAQIEIGQVADHAGRQGLPKVQPQGDRHAADADTEHVQIDAEPHGADLAQGHVALSLRNVVEAAHLEPEHGIVLADQRLGDAFFGQVDQAQAAPARWA